MALWLAAFGLVAIGLTSLLNFVIHFVQLIQVRGAGGWQCGECRPKVTCIKCGTAAPEFNLDDLRPALKFPRGQLGVIEDDPHGAA